MHITLGVRLGKASGKFVKCDHVWHCLCTSGDCSGNSCDTEKGQGAVWTGKPGLDTVDRDEAVCYWEGVTIAGEMKNWDILMKM